MCVYGGVAGGASQVLVLAVGDVLMCAGVTVFLGQAEVDDVDQVALLAQSHQEIVRLHISVDEVLGVDVFNAADLKGGGESMRGSIDLDSNNILDTIGINPALCCDVSSLQSPLPLCVSSTLALTIWSASSRTVLRLNFREQKLNRSSRLGPNNSITITL